ncbi:MAG TPA: alpha/beta hydrolase domain-containing protein [Alphaproteobacteria bacterium]|nr:alpha/beta hydrolase domain-containing protein [Alphaproteobacteria bacterium]
MAVIVGMGAGWLVGSARAADPQFPPLAYPLPQPMPELVPPLASWTIIPRSQASVPLGTVVPGDAPSMKDAARADAVALAGYGYVEEEYLVSGSLRNADGDTPYTTRILVRRPADPNNFGGTVQIEPLSGGSERGFAWDWAWPYMVADKDVWVGITVSQDDAAGMLRKFDAQRYAGVKIPSAAGWEDILVQVAWAMRAPDGLLAKLHFDDKAATVPGLFKIYASGWGDTGCLLRDFVDGGRAGRSRTPAGRPVIDAYILGECPGAAPIHAPADIAILQIASESAYRTPEQAAATAAARQPDIDLPKGRYRWYDVAGAVIAPCPAPAGHAPGMQYFLRALLADLDQWLRVGGHAPAGAVLELDADHRIKRDENGNALGGVRSYWVDVPTATVGARDSDGRCGESVVPFDKAQTARLYKDRADYVTKLTDDLIKLVNGNYMRAADSDQVISEATFQ